MVLTVIGWVAVPIRAALAVELRESVSAASDEPLTCAISPPLMIVSDFADTAPLIVTPRSFITSRLLPTNDEVIDRNELPLEFETAALPLEPVLIEREAETICISL